MSQVNNLSVVKHDLLDGHVVPSSSELDPAKASLTAFIALFTLTLIFLLIGTNHLNTYAVARLADGNCWMIENLRLADKKPDNTPITLNASNTNSPISTFTQLSASQDPTTTAWCTTDSSACDDQSMLFTGNTTNPVANMTASDTSTAVYSYGNYYNWYSATAGNGTYSTGANVVVNGDICPNGSLYPGTSNYDKYNDYSIRCLASSW